MIRAHQVWRAVCAGCGSRLEARSPREIREEAAERGWEYVWLDNYCGSCRKSAELAAGVPELAKGGGK